MSGTGERQWAAELRVAEDAVRAAAAEIARFYESRKAAIYTKKDQSPVTDADLASDRVIRTHIAAAFPDDAILTEEGSHDPAGRIATSRCWLADPLDGTQQFIERTGEFDIFLALVVDGRPVVAVSCQPPTGTLLSAVAGQGAWVEDGDGRRPLRGKAPSSNGRIRLGTNRYHTRAADWPILIRVAERAGLAPPEAPSVFHARAFFDLGHGAAYEAYLGLGTGPDGDELSGEWDMGAPDLILHEAGGLLTDDQGQPLRYNKPNPLFHHGLIAATDPAIHARLLAALQEERA